MHNRLATVKRELEKHNLDAILVSSVSNILYLTDFAGFSSQEREAYLFITKDEQCIITDGRYSEAIAFHIPHFKLLERTTTMPLEEIFKHLSKKFRTKRLGIEEDSLSVREYKTIKKHFDNTYHYTITKLRAIKDAAEIKTIEKACSLGDKAFLFISKKLEKGITEKELAFQLEMFIKKHDADLSFPTIVAFGKNSSVPHHQTSNKRLEASDQFVLLDFGVKLNNYCSDMTRTVFFGSTTAEYKRMYNTVLEAQKLAIENLSRCHAELARPERGRRVSASQMKKIPNQVRDDTGIKASEIDRVARSYIEQQGFPTIPHFLGHGVGLEVHESPRLGPNSKDELKPCMVFSVEPGIYLKGVGGVRIEDLVVLEKTGVRLLTKSPKDLVWL